MTEAEKKAKKETKKAEKKAQRDNLQKLIALLIGSVEGDEITAPMIGLAVSLKKKPRTAGLTGVKAVVMAMFEDVGDVVSEDDIWTDNRLGRAEMRKVTVNLIKKEKPEDRLWISFDPEEGVYTLVGKGAETPTGWTGYTPVKVDEIEIM